MCADIFMTVNLIFLDGSYIPGDEANDNKANIRNKITNRK
jgi:hypothetical protein